MPGFASLAQPWWVPVLWILALGHVTNICITLYLHRGATHGGVKYHPAVEHFFRAWLWLTTGMNTREWVAVHRKHHAFSDKPGDPHSPVEEGFWAIVLAGVFFYREAIQDQELLEKYGKGCPDDWMERRVYSRHRMLGLLLMLGLDVVLFGFGVGLLVWSAMAIWVPIFGNVINGIGHALGYRNFETKDHSRNIYPFGFWIVGEELHNNHHADPRSARFAARWWEFDVGWIYISALSALGLAEVIYARELSVGEFRQRYYRKERPAVGAPPSPVTAGGTPGLLTQTGAAARVRLERAGAGIERVRSDARAKLGRVRADARAELDEAMARLERVREDWSKEVEQAKATLDRMRTDAGAELTRLRADARSELDQARQRLEQTKARAATAIEQAQRAVEQAARRLEGGERGAANA